MKIKSPTFNSPWFEVKDGYIVYKHLSEIVPNDLLVLRCECAKCHARKKRYVPCSNPNCPLNAD